MNRRNAFLMALLAVLVTAGGAFFFHSETPTSAPAAASSLATTEASPQQNTPAPQVAVPSAAANIAPATDASSGYDPEQDDGQIAFKADANGRLMMNEKTRLDLERLYALFNPQERVRKMREVAETLPPAAMRELERVMEQYQNYQAAAHQVYPPGREMTTVEQGVSQIDGMHGLRVQYFGEPATKQMFGAEEKVQRDLYALMENEKDPGLTIEEKAERAQQIYQEQRGK